MRENIACPALGLDNTCSIYQARPNACRGTDSFDARICEASQGRSPLGWAFLNRRPGSEWSVTGSSRGPGLEL
ncbi:MAG: hypothetical protein IRZ13_16435, partial [Acetobacteraceae bacterium]|nr:hypothetical protein [Acetobacteraceae bacterium]